LKCPKCKVDNREGAKFCLECGKSLVLLCPQCGNILPIVAKFCDECGEKSEEFVSGRTNLVPAVLQRMSRNLTLKEAKSVFEISFLRDKLHEFNWNFSQTANAIGIERSNLHKKVKAYGLKRRSEKGERS
jgi:DNA-binding NtrC family response regulator